MMKLAVALLILYGFSIDTDASSIPRGSFNVDSEVLLELPLTPSELSDRKEEIPESKSDMRLVGIEYRFTREPTKLPTSKEPSDVPSLIPSEIPSESPSEIPSDFPSVSPSTLPPSSPSPTPHPTRPPIRPFTRPPTPEPTNTPTRPPSREPTRKPTPQPTSEPTRKPSTTPPPTRRPTREPTSRPTRRPTRRPTPQPIQAQRVENDLVTRFAVIGDIPYTRDHESRLKRHVDRLASNLEFLIHVGDIRNARSGSKCTLKEYQNVASILSKSPIPVFIVPGDNEYQDCPNFSESWRNWKRVFAGFHRKWNTPFRVFQDSQRPENFYFVHKRVLYIGLNIVGGTVHSASEWRSRLSYQWRWTRGLLNTYLPSKEASSVVIIGHADPRSEHNAFFDPLKNYINDEAGNKVPFLYFNGDRHRFQRNKNYRNRSNFHRIMVEGGRKENPLRMKISVPSSRDHGKLSISDIYSYNR
ncbi:unnamed protein product [Cylindrotheca closterium]|uniref:Calcineurin-like phosphoesterase domain-containing protein n=1 Tax=Cylindrotheca closterium TaxID=2856 RepID=A0AAD2G9S6_9STRA|nr:unnamed protein product [Cylindrotheca closterium]